MLRRLGIRGKVLAALSVPVIVLFALAGTLSWQGLRDVQVANTVTDMLNVLQESRTVATALQAERRVSVEFVADRIETRDALDDARQLTNDARARFSRAVDRVDLSNLEDTRIPGLVTSLEANWAATEAVRTRVDGGGTPFTATIAAYATTIDQTIAFPDQVANQLDDRRLASIISAQSDIRQLAENYHREQVFGDQMLAGSRFRNDVGTLASMFTASQANHARGILTVRDLDLGETVVVPALGASLDGRTSYDGYRVLIATGSPDNFRDVTPEAWTEAAATEIAALEPVQESLRQAANVRANQVSGAAVRTALVTSVIALLGIIASVVVALSIARQIVNPLRRLTDAAGQVREVLPRLVQQVAIPGQGPDLSLTQIPVTSRDEIGQLATAFNDVNATTIAVAQEQAALRGSIAEMFVNVARRDQILLNRQLSFIDALERSEEDPRVLADLFRLDHLATRMRRNSESLLVLAGIDSGRRVRETLPISDVIRTASSEIEHYERIQLDLPVDPMMLGHTVLPAAHLMAELLENATEFSEPGSPVHVATGLDDEAVIVEIADDGLGMTPEELADANSRIATSSAGEVLGSQRLGLHVVGRLATRLGAEVSLRGGRNGRGTVVTLRLPLVLFIDTINLPRVQPNQTHEGAQTFLLPEEVAGAPVALQDVPAGSIGAFDNPAEEVDLAALTAGETELGLPRRRSHDDVVAERRALRDADDAAAASSIPLAPRVEDLLDAAGETVEAWQPPLVIESQPLSAFRSEEAAPLPVDPGFLAAEGFAPQPAGGLPTGGLPTRRSALPGAPDGESTSGLPTRRPAEPAAPGSGLPSRAPAPAPIPLAPAGTATPAPAENRSAMFSGFRSRRAELAAASVNVDSGEPGVPPSSEPTAPMDSAARLAAAAAGSAAFFSRQAPVSEPVAAPEAEPALPFVIPAVLGDDGEPIWSPPVAEPVQVPVAEPVAEQPWAPVQVPVAEPVAEQPWAPVQVPVAEPVAEQPWAPTPWANLPVADAPVASAPATLLPRTPAWNAPESGRPEAPEPFAVPMLDPEPVAAMVPEPVQPAGPEMADSTEPLPEAAEPVPSYAPVAWGADAVAALVEPTFAAIVQGPEPTPKKRRRLFGRRKHDQATPAAVPTAAEPAPVLPAAPVALPEVAAPARSSAFERPQEPSLRTGRHRALTPVDLVPGGSAPVPAAPIPAPAAPIPVSAAAAVAPAPAVAPPPLNRPTWSPDGAVVPEAWTTRAPVPTGPPTAPPVGPAAASSPYQPPVFAPSPEAESFLSRPVPEQHGPAETFTPQFAMGGSLDEEITSALAQRADIAQQALAELSQIASYRPQRDTEGAAALTRRTPGTIPAAPEIERKSDAAAAPRDANQVRSVLSSFTSGASRGRAAGDPAPDTTTAPLGDAGLAPAGISPDPDPNSGDTSW